METKIKKTNEVIMGKKPLIENCPKCEAEMEHAWQSTVNYDDSNPVRMCHACDTAYIWQYYP